MAKYTQSRSFRTPSFLWKQTSGTLVLSVLIGSNSQIVAMATESQSGTNSDKIAVTSSPGTVFDASINTNENSGAEDSTEEGSDAWSTSSSDAGLNKSAANSSCSNESQSDANLKESQETQATPSTGESPNSQTNANPSGSTNSPTSSNPSGSPNSQTSTSQPKDPIRIDNDFSKEPEREDYYKEAGNFLIKPDTMFNAVAGQGQRFIMQNDPSAFVLPDSGCRFYKRRDQLVMHKGKMILIAGSRSNLELRTDFGEIDVPQKSAAIVEYRDDGIMRVYGIQGKAAVLTFRIAYRPYTYAADKGDEICVSKNETEKSRIIPKDGIEREEDLNIMPLYGATLYKSHLDLRELVEGEQLLDSNGSDDPLGRRIVSIKQQAKPLKRKKGSNESNDINSQLAFARKRHDLPL